MELKKLLLVIMFVLFGASVSAEELKIGDNNTEFNV